MTDNTPGGIKSLDAALQLLRIMAEQPGAVSLSELARLAAMPVSKVHRYLSNFCAHGYVIQKSHAGKYDLGPQALLLGLAAIGRNDFVNRASDGLPELSASTGLTVLVSVWGNAGATIVRWQRPAEFVLTTLSLGTSLPLLNSATGRATLAYLPRPLTRDAVRQELKMARLKSAVARDFVATEKGVVDLVERVRGDGYATVDGRLIPGLAAASAPILDWQGEAQAIVTLVGTDPTICESGSPALAELLTFCKAVSIAPEFSATTSAA